MKYIREIAIRVLAGESGTSILAGLPPAEKGHTGEALMRTLVLFGIHHTDPAATVIPYRVVTTTRRIEPLGFHERLEVFSTGLINAGGANKIDVAWRENNTVAVCSSKIGKGHIKSIADLEITDMLVQFTESGGYTEGGKRVDPSTVKSYSLVADSKEALSVADASKPSNKVSSDNLHPLDTETLNRMCAILCERTKRCASKDIETVLSNLLADHKQALRTRFHQKLMYRQGARLIHSGQRTILLGALPRSGKTWVGADFAKDHQRVLVITTRPGETRSQWNAVFSCHREFSGYAVRDLDSTSVPDIAHINRSGKSIIVIASTQFFKIADKERLTALIGLTWDIVLLDEIHAGGSTDLSDAMLDTYIGPSTIRIMMTATYTKPVLYFAIPEHCCLFWDLEDVRLMRTWGEPHVIQRLGEKHGIADIVAVRDEMYKSGETDVSIRACYTNAPRLGILTTVMQTDIYDELRIATSSPDNVYGFSMRSLLMPTKEGAAFQNQKAVDTFLALISGSDRMKHYKKGDMSMFTRILRFWKTVNHRDSDEFMTQLWFLPSGVGQLLGDVKPLLVGRIHANPVLKHFATLTLDSGMNNISKTVAAAVVDAKAQGKRGLILLTGNVGSLGVSMPEVDVAFMLHDFESADTNYQQLMRVLTEMVNKKYGIVVDFNVWRVLTTMNTYSTSRCGQTDKSSADRIRWCISNLVDVDPDLWQCAESSVSIPQDSIADELTRQWRRMLEKTGSSLQALAKTQVDLGEDQKELDQIATHLDEGANSSTLKVNPDQEKLPSGIESKGDASSKEDEEEDDEETDTIVDKKANINDVLSRIIPEFAILSGCKNDLVEALEAIISNPKQREAMNQFLIQLYGKSI
jgi:superfamily II DNA or RNA helicase